MSRSSTSRSSSSSRSPACSMPRLLLDEPRAVEPPRAKSRSANVSLRRQRRHPPARRGQLHVCARLACRAGRAEQQRQEPACRSCWRGSIPPTSGRITIGGTDLDTLPFAVVGAADRLCRRRRRICSPPSMRDNLLLGSAPPAASAGGRRVDRGRSAPRSRGGAPLRQYRARHRRRLDRLRSRPGWPTPPRLERRIIEVLALVDLDARRLSVRAARPARSGSATRRRRTAAGSAARASTKRLAADGLADLVERFDPDRYNTNASVARQPAVRHRRSDAAFAEAALAENPLCRPVLRETGLRPRPAARRASISPI